jgi:hypothetical protein
MFAVSFLWGSSSIQVFFQIGLSRVDEFSSIYMGEHVFGLQLMLSIYINVVVRSFCLAGKGDDRNSVWLIDSQVGGSR